MEADPEKPDKKGELHMDPYMMVYRTQEQWPITGTQVTQKAYFFFDITAAHSYRDKLIDIYSETLTDVQIYEYTGIQYVLVERWHKDA